MSVTISSLLGFPEDPRRVELVNSLLQKTIQSKVAWSKNGNAITASLPDGIVANFVLAPSIVAWGASWQLFTVRDRQGSELIRVDAPGFLIANSPSIGLVGATNELFKAVHGSSADDLDRAIDSLKKL